jgi:4'-phosphopantetheinyl transferase
MPGPGRREVCQREVELWIVRLEASEENYERAHSWLPEDEAARAKRFYFERHARAFVLGRAALRALLASYLEVAPAEVGFVYGPHGKPALAQNQDAERVLQFNVSNSGDLAAYVFTSGCEIGVDVEKHRKLHNFEDIAQRFFSPAETAELLELPATERTAAFFRCWSRKEAYIKALGGGLSIPLDSFQVTLRPSVAPRMVTLGGSEETASQWTLHTFDPGPNFAGAIAYQDQPRSLQANPVVSADELLNPYFET